jgi:hypothetical protein
MPRERSYFVDRLPDRKGELLALAWLLEETKTTGKKGLLVVPLISHITDVLPELIGEAAAKAIAKTRSYRDSSGVAFDVASWSKIPTSWPGPVLTLWPDGKTLDKLDAMYSVTALAAVTWNPDEIQQWKSTWRPVDLATGQPMESASRLSPVVDAGLRRLTHRVNVSTGLGHPSDRSAGLDLFRKLKSASFDLDEGGIKSRLIQLGWSANHAEQVGEMVAGVNAGRRFTGGRDSWPADLIQQLKDEVQGKSESATT